MPSYYSTIPKVIQNTGVRPEDFGFNTTVGSLTPTQQLENLVEEWLVEATDLINEDRNRNYASEVESGKRDRVPAGIENIATRLASNMAALAVLRRETPIVKSDDYDIKLVTDKVFTDAIRKDLAKYPYKPNIGMMVIRKETDEDPEEE